MNPKKIVIFGGGTITHVRSHLALCAPAYGNTARQIDSFCQQMIPNMDRELILTKMADPEKSKIETNENLWDAAGEVIADLSTKIVFFSCAVCDYRGEILDNDGLTTESGKYATRLKTKDHPPTMRLYPDHKIIKRFRQGPGSRKDIFLVGFKTTCGATEDEQYIAGLGLLKTASCNLVLANDTKNRLNMVITPEEARYHITNERSAALLGLIEMANLRSQLTFTRSTVVAGDHVPWNSSEVPETLRTIVNYCVKRGAYKVFNGATVGHFAAKINETTFLTSMRKTNFNDIEKNGLVRIVTDGPDTVLAYGAKPSVGGQSQRIVFNDHPDCDLIIHFHCPIKQGSEVPTVSQREYECGSHQCGRNTSQGLKKFGNLYAVYLDQHGPNIVFNRNIDPQEVINFIEANFDLEDKTGGLVSLPDTKFKMPPLGVRISPEMIKDLNDR